MILRFFKLLYFFCLLILIFSLPIYLYVEYSKYGIYKITYKPKCLSNSQYIVFEGSRLDEHITIDDILFRNKDYMEEFSRDLNFYCKYFQEVQPYIMAYINSKTTNEQRLANINFFTFKESVYDNIYSYPKLFDLEIVDKKIQYYRIYGPIISWLIYALSVFIFLQFIRMCIIYIVYGKIDWHPFKFLKINNKIK